jgi:hypothetical protein
MTSKEIIRRIIERDSPPRIGFSFNAPHQNDLREVSAIRYLPDPETAQYREWGEYPELLARVPHFHGEVRLDEYGNVLGRLNKITKGECVRGALSDWADFAQYRLPQPDMSWYAELKERLAGNDRYVAAGLPCAVFSTLRDVRLMDNALMDTLLEPDNVRAFLNRIVEQASSVCAPLKEAGADAVWIYDDWGVQDRTFIGLETFSDLFVPAYQKICDAAHSAGLHVFLHSCGKTSSFIPPLIDAGINVFQFDQPDVYPVSWLAEHFAEKAAFFCPVDIQRVMPTGDRGLIESSALELVQAFRERGASIIAKDYPGWADIAVKEEWADWARDVFIKHADNGLQGG